MRDQVNFHRRRAGLALPLSALNSEQGLGIGDAAALERFFDWMNDAGLSVLQLLPLGDLGPGDACPYAAMSALAFDALAYADPLALPELRGRATADGALRRAAKLRRARRVPFAEARALKREAFLEAFRSFERSGSTERREAFGYFRGSNDDWLEEYALFRALKEEAGWTPWQTWDREIRDLEPKALAAARARLIETVRFHEWLQWTMHEQWAALRRSAQRRGVLLFGDLPFGIGRESADVWARQADFDFSAVMGAPPDKYSATGQDWGLPAYRWDKMEEGGHQWWRRRLRQAGELYDLFRLDHAIGFFRTWQVRGGPPQDRFDVSTDDEARERGRRFFAMAKTASAPAYPVAEDLGVVPEYMPAVLSSLDVPGYRIAPWMRRPDGVTEPPSGYPALSVATLANHDMPPFARWWREAPSHERDSYWRMASGTQEPAPSLRAGALRTVLENLYGAGSALVLLQFQDVFGSQHRINVPGTVTARNWTYRVPYTVEALRRDTRPRKTAELLRSLALSSGRL
ncbi:MAG: 4-alpha-glucanotransferase [Elusimicrobia bacterium]|nr:4-alpha-glucanotransferase [Elusimicrobiota bacterium]